MKYIVTGGAGFIGSHLCEELVKEGHEVVIIDHLSTGRKENIEHLLKNDSHATFYQETITDLEFLMKTFQGADGVFHQAAMVSVPASVMHPISNHDINITGTLNVLIAARDTGVKKVVAASSAAIYGNLPGLPKREDDPVDPLSPYALAKLTGEYYGKLFTDLYGLATASLRYFNVYGPRQDPHSDYAAVIPKFIERLSNGDPPLIFGDGEQTRDFVYVKDAVQANIKAMESDATGVFNVASGKETSVNELASILSKLFGFAGKPEYAPERPGDVKRSVADISKAKEAFGFEPAYTLEKGLAEMGR
jgi:UDP-glucose 4-epimerase